MTPHAGSAISNKTSMMGDMMKPLFAKLCLMICLLAPAAFAEGDASPDQAKVLALEYNKRMNKMLSAGSTVADVDNLFALYAKDFVYNHPGQGDVYDTQYLYNNSVKYVKAGHFDGSYQQKITNMIVGKNGVMLEWTVPGGDGSKRVTLIETRGDKIIHIKEFW